MKAGVLLGVVLSAAVLAGAGPVLAQGQVEVRAPAPEPRFEIVPSGPAAREASRPRESDFYQEEVGVRHEPAFIEPLAGETAAGNRYGFSGWTAPATPVGSLGSRSPWAGTGWFALGFTFTWDAPPPAKRPAAPPR